MLKQMLMHAKCIGSGMWDVAEISVNPTRSFLVTMWIMTHVCQRQGQV